MAKVRMSNGEYFQVDAKLAPFFGLHKWHKNRSGYAATKIRGKYFYAQYLLVKYSSNQELDHINRDRLDNRLSNLRVVSKAENRFNSGMLCSNTSGAKGVSRNKKLGKWSACIGNGPRRVHLGTYDTIERAAFAYNVAAQIRYGEYGFRNKLHPKLEAAFIHSGLIIRAVKKTLKFKGRLYLK